LFEKSTNTLSQQTSSVAS